jgi:hypothetical protein
MILKKALSLSLNSTNKLKLPKHSNKLHSWMKILVREKTLMRVEMIKKHALQLHSQKEKIKSSKQIVAIRMSRYKSQ